MIAYNNVYRSLNVKRGASMSAIYVNNNIDAFTVLIRKNLGRFIKRLLYCDSKLISCIVTSYFSYSTLATLPNVRIYYSLNFYCLLMY